MQYYGCSRLLILKDEKWSEIQGPESLAGKGWAVRQGKRNDINMVRKLETIGSPAESVSNGGR